MRLLREIKIRQALAAMPNAHAAVAKIVPPEVAPLDGGRVRRRRDDGLLLVVATRYDEARERQSRKPALDTWEALRKVDGLRYSIGTVRQLIREARAKGLLTPTSHGSGKGRLTDKARELLAPKPPRVAP